MWLTRAERMAHLDLTTPCEFDGESVTTRGRRGRLSLLKLLGLTDDWVGPKHKNCVTCHVCDHGSNNGWCNNPLHIYIGRQWENVYLDKTPAARSSSVHNLPKTHIPDYKAVNSQVWVSLITGHKSTAAGVANHNRRLGHPDWRLRLK